MASTSAPAIAPSWMRSRRLARRLPFDPFGSLAHFEIAVLHTGIEERPLIGRHVVEKTLDEIESGLEARPSVQRTRRRARSVPTPRRLRGGARTR